MFPDPAPKPTESTQDLMTKTCFEDASVVQAECRSLAAQETLRALTARIKKTTRPIPKRDNAEVSQNVTE